MKDFFKHLSVYGILPVVGKFIGFFLIPIYARIFNAAEFGYLELFVSLVMLLTFAINLEFYTAIGRYFNDYRSKLGQKTLISSGLFITLLSAFIVVLLYWFFKPIILNEYVGSLSYSWEFLLAGIWFPISAISTYLSVIPRYRKRSKKYVIYTSISIFIRVISTIFYVLVLKLGLSGVLLGHITGATLSTILYYYDSREYIGFSVNIKVLKKILKFSLPIIPGLLIIGTWRPIFNYLVKIHLSVEALGTFGFALRIISILAILQAAINLTWKPLVFDSFKKKNFIINFKNISSFISVFLLYICLGFSILSNELIQLLGTDDFLSAASVLGILSLNWYFNIMSGIRGIAPFLNENTKITSYVQLIALIFGLVFLLLFGNSLVAISIAFTIFNFVKYILLYIYSSYILNVSFFSIHESVLLVLNIVFVSLSFYNMTLIIRLGIFCCIAFAFILLIINNKKLLLAK